MKVAIIICKWVCGQYVSTRSTLRPSLHVYGIRTYTSQHLRYEFLTTLLTSHLHHYFSGATLTKTHTHKDLVSILSNKLFLNIIFTKYLWVWVRVSVAPLKYYHLPLAIFYPPLKYLGGFFWLFYRLRRETPISQNWLKG